MPYRRTPHRSTTRHGQKPGTNGLPRWVGLSIALGASAIWLASRSSEIGFTHSSMEPAPSDFGPIWVPLAGILALMAMNAALVSGEAAIELLRPAHVKHLKETNEDRARRLQELLDNRPRYVAACSLGCHILRLCIAVLAFATLVPPILSAGVERFGWVYSYTNWALVGLILMIPIGGLHLIFGELLPKSYAVLHPHRMAASLYRVVSVAAALLSWIAMSLTGIAGLVTSRFGGKASFSIPNAAEEEILNLVETAEEQGEIESEERALLRSVFDFSDTVAREIMTPRVDLDALPARSDPMEVVRLIQDSGHSRIPLYEETDDQIVGIIHAKDLLLAMLNGRAPNLKSLMRPALFVPENKNLYELITEMRQQRTQMAIVQDEFGGTAGIVTVEDIVEELVGEIVDEYDVEVPDIVEVEDGWLIEGKTHVDDVGEAIGTEFTSEEFDTIGGYVFGLFGRQPKQDEEIEADGVTFRIAETDGRRIVRLHVRLIEAPLEPEAGLSSQE